MHGGGHLRSLDVTSVQRQTGLARNAKGVTITVTIAYGNYRAAAPVEPFDSDFITGRTSRDRPSRNTVLLALIA